MTEPRRVPGDVLVHLRRARDHLDRHYAEEFDLDLVADLAGMSRYHFPGSFGPAAGGQPHGHRGLPRGRLLQPRVVQLEVREYSPEDFEGADLGGS